MSKYPTDEMVDAAMDALEGGSEWREHREDYLLFLTDLRAALIAADRAAWRPISEAPTDTTAYPEHRLYLVRAILPERHQPDDLAPFTCTAAYHPDGGWCVDELREVEYFRPLPLPPITSVGSPPEARIVAAEVPAPSADVSPLEGVG